MEDDLILKKMEHNLIVWPNARRHQFLAKWKTTLILSLMEDDIIFLANGRWPQLFGNLEDDQSFLLGKAGITSPSFSLALISPSLFYPLLFLIFNAKLFLSAMSTYKYSRQHDLTERLCCMPSELSLIYSAWFSQQINHNKTNSLLDFY
jgi:hypothetical protein